MILPWTGLGTNARRFVVIGQEAISYLKTAFNTAANRTPPFSSCSSTTYSYFCT